MLLLTSTLRVMSDSLDPASLPPLCMGTMTFGRESDPAAARALFKRCRERGIHFFDCANAYAGGDSERILGELIADCRDEVVITSKVGMGPNGGLAPDTIRQSIDDSLERLATDYVDIYFCHRFDDDVPMADSLGTMAELVDGGKVRAIGVSNWAAWQVARGIGLAEARGIAPIRFLQPMYNLVKRTAEIELLPMALAEGVGVIPYNPLGGGLLTGKYTDGTASEEARLKRQENYGKRYLADDYLEVARRFVAFAREQGYHPVTLAIAWVMKNPAVTAPILGARNLEQLEPALGALELAVGDDLYGEICALTPRVPPATDRTEA